MDIADILKLMDSVTADIRDIRKSSQKSLEMIRVYDQMVGVAFAILSQMVDQKSGYDHMTRVSAMKGIASMSSLFKLMPKV